MLLYREATGAEDQRGGRQQKELNEAAGKEQEADSKYDLSSEFLVSYGLRVREAIAKELTKWAEKLYNDSNGSLVLRPTPRRFAELTENPLSPIDFSIEKAEETWGPSFPPNPLYRLYGDNRENSFYLEDNDLTFWEVTLSAATSDEVSHNRFGLLIASENILMQGPEMSERARPINPEGFRYSAFFIDTVPLGKRLPMRTGQPLLQGSIFDDGFEVTTLGSNLDFNSYSKAAWDKITTSIKSHGKPEELGFRESPQAAISALLETRLDALDGAIFNSTPKDKKPPTLSAKDTTFDMARDALRAALGVEDQGIIWVSGFSEKETGNRLVTPSEDKKGDEWVSTEFKNGISFSLGGGLAWYFTPVDNFDKGQSDPEVKFMARLEGQNSILFPALFNMQMRPGHRSNLGVLAVPDTILRSSAFTGLDHLEGFSTLVYEAIYPQHKITLELLKSCIS